MTRTSARLKLTSAVVALAAVGLAVAEGGAQERGDLPAGAAAIVGEAVIDRDRFDRWLRASTEAAKRGRATAQDRRCISTDRPTASSRDTSSGKQLEQQCRSERTQLRSSVMQFLIAAEWIEQEAAAQGVKISAAEIRRRFARAKARAFRGPNATGRYQAFLEQSVATQPDLLFRYRVEVLEQELVERATAGQRAVGDAEVRRYYEDNAARFAKPERRDVQTVVAKSRNLATRAKAALAQGGSFRAAARALEADRSSRAHAGELSAVAKGQQQDAALDRAIFSASAGELEGPVKTGLGYYVFEVTRITPASRASFDEAKGTIASVLRSQRQQSALERFRDRLGARHRKQTVCARDLVVPECRNAPERQQGARRGRRAERQAAVPLDGARAVPPPRTAP